MDRPDFLNLKAGDVVAVRQPPHDPWLGTVLFVEGGARTADPYYAQVIREDDLAVIGIDPAWVVERLPKAVQRPEEP